MSDKLLTTDDIKFLYNELRKSSVIWDGRKEVLRRCRKKVFVRRAKNGNPVYKYQWQCAKCKRWYKNEADMEVDHIVEIGGATSFDASTIAEMVNKIFPRPVEEHMQALCVVCHLQKTNKYMAANRKWERKK